MQRFVGGSNSNNTTTSSSSRSRQQQRPQPLKQHHQQRYLYQLLLDSDPAPLTPPPFDSAASSVSSSRTSDSGLGFGGGAGIFSGSGGVAGGGGQAPGLRRMQFPRPVQIHHVMPEPTSESAAPNRPRSLPQQQQQQRHQTVFSIGAGDGGSGSGPPPPPPSYNSNHTVLPHSAQQQQQQQPQSQSQQQTAQHAQGGLISVVRGFGACGKCGKEVSSPNGACQAMGSIYHSGCFVCSCCGRELTGLTFYAVPSPTEGAPPTIYCAQDFLYTGFQQAAEKCSACGHMITDHILQALGRPFHPACFRCSVCQTCLDSRPFTVDPAGSVFCVPDYHRVYAPRCGLCRLPITPESDDDQEVLRVVSMGKDFHPACYRCQDCGLQLNNENHRRCYPMLVRGHPDQLSLLCYGCRINRENR